MPPSGAEPEGGAPGGGKPPLSRGQAADYDIPIPVGTVCQTEGEEPVQVTTTQAGTLAAGQLTVDCPARPAWREKGEIWPPERRW